MFNSQQVYRLLIQKNLSAAKQSHTVTTTSERNRIHEAEKQPFVEVLFCPKIADYRSTIVFWRFPGFGRLSLWQG